jgi:hypothetical protein
MAVSLDQLLYGIRRTESGGNYSVVNSIGAVGAYQVMKANIPGWTRAALGRSLTWQQFRDSPSAQDAVARFIVGGYYRKYGAEGAAAMWFSGQPNPNSRASDGGNTVRQYVDKVIGGSQGGTVSTSTYSGATGGGSSVGSGMAKMTPAETAESYGFVQALLDSNPELKKLFNSAIAGSWTAQKFQASLRDTRWYKTHSQTERDFLVTQFGDPATANQKLTQARTQITQLGAQIGIQWNKSMNSVLNTAAYNMVAKGWTTDQARYYLGQYVQFPKGVFSGEAGQDVDQLHKLSYDMGIKNSDAWYGTAVRNIVRGSSSLEDYQSQIRNQAKALFPTWSKQIDAGQTVADLASPYMQSMSTILEVPPGSVNLFDPLIKKAIQYKDPRTGQNAAQPIWQFETTLRSDPRWKATKNAQDSMMQAAHQVLSDFGVKY